MQRLGTNLAGRCKSVVSSGFPWVEQYQVQTRVSQPLKALGYLTGQCYLAAAIGMLSSQNQMDIFAPISEYTRSFRLAATR